MSSVDIVSVTRPGCRLAAAVHLPAKTPSGAVVCCHGLLSSKESAKFIALGEELSRAGLASVRFDFSGCGESDSPPERSLLEARMRDLAAILKFVRHQTWLNGPVSLLGSSLGGFLSLLTAAAEGEGGIRSVVCWATPYSLARIRRAIEEEPGENPLGPGMDLGGPDDLDSLPPIPRVLILHGQEDELVPWMQAVSIYRKVGEPRKLMLMKTADHQIIDPSWRRMAMELSVKWLLDQMA